jgi:hypothetical protein
MAPFRTAASSDKRALVCGWLALAAVVLGAAVVSVGSLPTHRALPDGVRSPVLALELIRSPTRLGDIASTADEQRRLRTATYVDFAFIASYTAFFVALGAFTATAVPSVGKPLAVVIVGAAIGAALFDVMENRAMLALLQGASSAAPRGPSLWKWRLIFIAVAMSAPAFVDRAAPPFRRTVGYVGALGAVAAAIQGIVGTSAAMSRGEIGDARGIESAAGWLSSTLVLATVFFLTRRTLRGGVLHALDRLAATRALHWLVDWPTPDRDDVVGAPVVPSAERPRG